MKYKTVALYEVCNLVPGFAFKSENFGDYQDKVIKIGDIVPPDVDMEHLPGVDISCYNKDKLKQYLVSAGDYVLAMTGSTIGKVGRIRNGQAYINQRVLVFRPKDIIDSDYLYYVLSQPLFRQFVVNHADSETAKPNISASSTSKFSFSLPTIDIQRKIGGLLSALDNKIAINKAINKNLEATAQAIFQDMFIGNYDPNWKNGTIDDLGTIVSGGTPSTTKPEHYCANGIPWITPKDLSLNSSKFIYRGKIDISEFGLKNSSAKILPKGSVLFSSRAPIGYIAIAANDVTTNQGFKSIIPADEIGTAFVYFFLKQSLSIIEGRASGSTFKEVSGTTMKSVPAVIPDVKKLNEFNLLCVPIFNKQKKVEAENQRLAAIRDALLPKLMSGEIDVSQVKI